MFLFLFVNPARLQEGDRHQGERREGASVVHLSRAAETSHQQSRQLLSRHLLHLAKSQYASAKASKSE